jgi:hypothetical protein
MDHCEVEREMARARNTRHRQVNFRGFKGREIVQSLRKKKNNCFTYVFMVDVHSL